MDFEETMTIQEARKQQVVLINTIPKISSPLFLRNSKVPIFKNFSQPPLLAFYHKSRTPSFKKEGGSSCGFTHILSTFAGQIYREMDGAPYLFCFCLQGLGH